MKTLMASRRAGTSIDLFEKRQQPGLFEMLLTGQRTFDQAHGGPIAGKFIDQRGAVPAFERTSGDLRRQHIRSVHQPSMRFLLRRHMRGLRERQVLKNEDDDAIMSRVDKEQAAQE